MVRATDAPNPNDAPPPMDMGRLLDNLGGDSEVARELMRLFVDDLTERLPELEQAFRDGDQETVQRQAHTLKGAGSNLCAPRFSRLAFDILQVAKEGERGPTRAMVDALKEEADRLRRHMTDLLAQEET